MNQVQFWLRLQDMTSNSPDYVFTSVRELPIRNRNRDTVFDIALLEEAILRANQIMLDISNYEVNISEILGMRNLSAFVGEVFARSVAASSQGYFISNPHQDGYPDLLLMDEAGQREYARYANNLRDKLPFSPFATGGLEVKATCGSVPTPASLAKRGLEKPGIGDQRVELLAGYDWKAHHRDTNNLLGILWDFVDGMPIITAVFYSSDLTEADWGKIVQPREGGGRTTSVSIMGSSGIKKMYDGCLCVISDERYISFLNRKNQATKLSLTGF